MASAFLSRTPSKLGKVSGAPLVLRRLIVRGTTVSFSTPPQCKYVSVSQVPASSYYRNCSSFPFIFVSLLIRSWERKPFVCSGSALAQWSLDPEGPSSQNPRIVLIVCVITKCRQVSLETCYTGLSWQRDHKMTEQPMIFESLEGGASLLLHIIFLACS